MNILSLHELKPGMILGESIYCKQTNRLLLNYGTCLTPKMITLLRNTDIKTVKIAERYTILVKPTETMATSLHALFSSTLSRLVSPELEANTRDDMLAISKRTKLTLDKLILNESLLEFCVEMKLIDSQFLFPHAINTCVLSTLLAGAMDVSDDEMYNIAAAALLHDIGLCEMPFLINSSDRSAHQELLWQEHPTYGFYFTNEHLISREISHMILHHHELWDGSGFPNKLSGTDIPLGSRIISVCNEYDNLITLKKYQPYQAIEHLYCSGGTLFDATIVNLFTNSIAVYPLGALVRLTTKEVGIVVNVRKNQGPRPIVRVYYNRVNKPLTTPKLIDLGEEMTVFIEEVLN